MKQLYWDCSGGAAGDMLLASLYELAPDQAAALAVLNGLGLAAYGVSYAPADAEDHGLRGTHMSVVMDGEVEDASHHDHRNLGDVYAILDGLSASPRVREQAKAVYRAIARAESAVHGRPVAHVHFHELGALDAIADIAGTAALLELLGPEKITASPVAVGSGTVQCAHGLLPVPAPATARLLEGLPICPGQAPGELCTPTGAALLGQFVSEFGPMPALRLLKSGMGMGTRRYETSLNAVRAFWGETDAESNDAVAELACNLDDMTGEALAFAVEALMAQGALDVWTAPITMKKGRPGVTLHLLCPPGQAAKFAALIFRHTTTLGVRQSLCSRYLLTRGQTVAETKYGPVRVKTARGYGVTRQKPEYEDLAAMAKKEGLSLEQASQLVKILF